MKTPAAVIAMCGYVAGVVTVSLYRRSWRKQYHASWWALIKSDLADACDGPDLLTDDVVEGATCLSGGAR